MAAAPSILAGIYGHNQTTHVTRSRPTRQRGARQKLVAAGGILAAMAASSCCIVPLLLFSLGVSGAWIGNLTRLAPYQPDFCRYDACLSRLRLLAGLARPPHNLRWRRGLLPAVAQQGRLPALGAATLLVAAAVALDFVAPLDPHLTIGDDHMAKLLFGARLGAFSAQYTVLRRRKDGDTCG